MPTSLGPAEILVILVVALIVLGPKRLPEAGRQVGKAIAEVRRWTTEVTSEIKSAVDIEVPAKSTVVKPVVVPDTVDRGGDQPRNRRRPPPRSSRRRSVAEAGPALVADHAADTAARLAGAPARGSRPPLGGSHRHHRGRPDEAARSPTTGTRTSTTAATGCRSSATSPSCGGG